MHGDLVGALCITIFKESALWKRSANQCCTYSVHACVSDSACEMGEQRTGAQISYTKPHACVIVVIVVMVTSCTHYYKCIYTHWHVTHNMYTHAHNESNAVILKASIYLT